MSERFVASDGVGIAWQAWGEDATLPPVLLHHGFAVNATINWVGPGIVAALTATGRRVVAIDARGHGASDKPHDPSFYGESRMAKDLGQLVDVLGVETVDLVGYSMGGIVSLIFASSDTRIRRLIVGGIGEGVLLKGGADTRVIGRTVVAAALRADDPSDSPAAALQFRRLADAAGADRFALAAQASAMHAQPIPLDRITARTLVLAGDADPLAANPENLAAAIKGARTVVIPGDHLSVVGTPRFAEEIVRFLS